MSTRTDTSHSAAGGAPAAEDPPPGDTGHTPDDATEGTGREPGEPQPPDRPPPDPHGAPAEPRRYGLSVVVLAVVAGLLVGFAAAMVALRPDPTPGESSAEAGFVRDMTAHHSQAVDMGTIAMDRATTVQVRNLGLDIALTQQYEMGMMQQWLRDWGLPPSGPDPPMAWMGEEHTVEDGLMPGMATREEMNRLRDAEGIEVDLIFLDLMITHHLGGVHMVDGVLERSDHPEVTRLATAMEQVQAGEVHEMVKLRDTLEAEAADS